MVFRDGAWFQRRWQTGFDGKETNVDEKRVDYVLGSGNHSRTLLHLTEQNTLQELPLGWYCGEGRLLGDESRLRSPRLRGFSAPDLLRVHVLP